MQKVSKKVFETVQRAKGYVPYIKGHSINFTTGKGYTIWTFKEIPLEYHEPKTTHKP